MGIGVGVSPGPVLPGDGEFLFDGFVEGFEVGVVDGPVRADPVVGKGREVRRVKAGAVAGVVDHRAAHPPAGVVLAQLDRVLAADHALLSPVQVVRAGLVGHPVLVGMPERTRLDDHDPPASAGQTLRQHRATRPRAHDAQVDLVVVAIAGHRVLAGQVAPMHVEQEARVVVGGPDGALEQPADHGSSSWVARTGSSAVAPGRSCGSRVLSGPRRM